jgi:hypothetical protein
MWQCGIGVQHVVIYAMNELWIFSSRPFAFPSSTTPKFQTQSKKPKTGTTILERSKTPKPNAAFKNVVVVGAQKPNYEMPFSHSTLPPSHF